MPAIVRERTALAIGAMVLTLSAAAGAEAQTVPAERASALRREAFTELAADPCNVPISRLQAIVKGMNQAGLSESDYTWNDIRLTLCARTRGNGLAPFEEALWAMTDARALDPCLYDPGKDYAAEVYADPRYLAFARRIHYDDPTTAGRFERYIEGMSPERRACFFDLLETAVTGAAWVPRPPSGASSPGSAAVRQGGAPSPRVAGSPAATRPSPSPPPNIAPPPNVATAGRGRAAEPPPTPAAPPQPPPAVAPPPSSPPETTAPPAALTSPTEGELAGVDLAQRTLMLRLRGGDAVVPFGFDETTAVSALDGNARQLVRSEGRALENVRSVRLHWVPDPADASRRLIFRITITAMN